MSDSTLTIVANTTAKTATLTGNPAFGESVAVTISGLPVDVTSSELSLMVTNYDAKVMALSTTFSGTLGTFTCSLDLNTTQLFKEFKGIAARVTIPFPIVLWRNTTYNDMMFSATLNILSNPYASSTTPVDVSINPVTFVGSTSVEDNIPTFYDTTGTKIKDSGYAISDFEPANSNIQTHISSTSNPHSVTKTQVGLGNVSNYDTTNASNIISGTLDGDRLPAISATKKGGVPATGTPSNKFLRDDGTWSNPAGAGDVTGPATNTDSYVPQWDGINSKTLKNGIAVGNSANNLVRYDSNARYPANDGRNIVGVQKVNTGLISGGLVTINTDATKFNIAAGSGIIVTYDDNNNPTYTPISWSTQTGISATYLASTPASWVYIDNTGTVQQTPNEGSATQNRQRIYICKLVHTASTVITSVTPVAVLLYDDLQTLNDFMMSVGLINLSGNVFAAAGTNLTIRKTAGTSFRRAANYATSQMSPNITDGNAIDPCTFVYRHQDGTGGWITGSSTSNINPNNYDNGTGTLATVDNNKFTNQRIFFFPISNTIVVQYGQKMYDSIAAAREGVEYDAVMTDPLMDDASLRCILIVKKGTTNLSTTTDATFMPGNKFNQFSAGGSSSGTGEANTASNLGTGTGWYAQKLGVDLQFKSLVAGTNVTVTDTGAEVTVNALDGYPATADFTTSGKILTTSIAGDSNTKLQLHFDGNLTDASPAGHTITDVSTTSDTSNVKFGTASRAFGGSAYLTVADSSDWTLGGSDFNINFWVRLSSVSGVQPFFDQRNVSLDSHQECFWESNYLNFKATNLSSSWILRAKCAWTPSTATWYHIKIARASGVLKMFIDGVSQTITYDTGTGAETLPAYSAVLSIGRKVYQGPYYLSGNIDEFQWQLGTAGTFTDFAPPTSAYADTTKSVIQVQPDISRCQGRLTLSSSDPTPTSDITAATTLYWLKYNGNQVALYNGSAWVMATIGNPSISLSTTSANTNYDVFVYTSGITPTLELTAWTNATTRATALTTQDGIYVKSGDTTRRYLGTIRTTATAGQCEDSATKRFCWNYYNQKTISVYIKEATSHTYNSDTRRTWNNNSSAQLKMVVGFIVNSSFSLLNAGNTNNELTIGLNSTSSDYGATSLNPTSTLFVISGVAYPPLSIGYNSINVLERATTGTASFNYTILNGSFLG